MVNFIPALMVTIVSTVIVGAEFAPLITAVPSVFMPLGALVVEVCGTLRITPEGISQFSVITACFSPAVTQISLPSVAFDRALSIEP